MMDLFKAMQVMQNPQQAIMQYAVRGMIQQHPDQWKQVQEMFQNKGRKQQVAELKKLYASKGMDLDATAKQWGISI